MAGSKTNEMTRGEGMAAVRSIPPGQDYVWDGEDDDDRPTSEEELAAAVVSRRRKRGRPAGTTKVSTTIRLSREVVDRFRATGDGWQTRVDEALKEWIRAHPPA